MASGDSLISFTADCAEGHYGSDWYIDTLSVGKPSEPILYLQSLSRKYIYIGVQNSIVYFSGVLPQHYSGGGLTVRIYYSTIDSGGIGNTWSGQSITLNIAFDRIGNDVGNLDALSFATAKSTSVTPPSYYYLQSNSIDFSNGGEIDSLQAGELFVMKFYYSATHPSMPCNIHKIVIEET